MIWNFVFDAKPAEPAIGKVDPDFAAERSFRANRKHIADDQHPQHQHRINRWSAKRRTVRRQLRPKAQVVAARKAQSEYMFSALPPLGDRCADVAALMTNGTPPATR